GALRREMHQTKRRAMQKTNQVVIRAGGRGRRSYGSLHNVVSRVAQLNRAGYEGYVARFAENLSCRPGPLQGRGKSITNCDLGLGFEVRGQLAVAGARRKAACDADPLRGELPLRAQIVGPGSRPSVSRVIGRRTVVEAAGLVCSEAVDACRQPLPAPLQAGKRE